MNKTQKLREFDELVDAYDRAGLAEAWNLADWLVENVPVGKPGPKSGARAPELTISELAERRGVGETWLKHSRITAREFPEDVRVPGVSVRAHYEALRKVGGSADKATKLLRKGGKLRDVSGPMESVDAMISNLRSRSPEDRAKLAAAALETPEARHQLATTDEGRQVVARANTEAQERQRRQTERTNRQTEQETGERSREFSHYFLMKAGDARYKARDAKADLESAERAGELDESNERDLLIASSRMTAREWELLAIKAEGGDIEEEFATLLASEADGE